MTSSGLLSKREIEICHLHCFLEYYDMPSKNQGALPFPAKTLGVLWAGTLSVVSVHLSICARHGIASERVRVGNECAPAKCLGRIRTVLWSTWRDLKERVGKNRCCLLYDWWNVRMKSVWDGAHYDNAQVERVLGYFELHTKNLQFIWIGVTVSCRQVPCKCTGVCVCLGLSHDKQPVISHEVS